MKRKTSSKDAEKLPARRVFKPTKWDVQQGFTLLELLVVVAILATVAFIATGAFRHVRGQANDGLVRVEMQEIAQAIAQFKQDTGYYPKMGPFALSDTNGIPHSNLPPGAIGNKAAQLRWFYSPANFWLLLTRTSPLNGTGHPLEQWTPEAGRGWRGPYLKGFENSDFIVRDDINDGTAAGHAAGDPMFGVEITGVKGLADPFEQRHSSQPYFVFGLTNDPWLVSSGPDGDYQTDDDIELSID